MVRGRGFDSLISYFLVRTFRVTYVISSTLERVFGPLRLVEVRSSNMVTNGNRKKFLTFGRGVSASLEDSYGLAVGI